MSHLEEQSTKHRSAFQEEYYFFYGTLMDRSCLAKALKRPHRLELQPAKLAGWICKMWGEYPALVTAPSENSSNQSVHGVACEIQTIMERDRLIKYETAAYRLEDCWIELERGSSVRGKTFIWDGNLESLCEGTFDLKDWILKQQDV